MVGAAGFGAALSHPAPLGPSLLSVSDLCSSLCIHLSAPLMTAPEERRRLPWTLLAPSRYPVGLGSFVNKI